MILKLDLLHNHDARKNLHGERIYNSVKWKAMDDFTEDSQKLIRIEVSSEFPVCRKHKYLRHSMYLENYMQRTTCRFTISISKQKN